MHLQNIFIGGWFQRTTLHLSEMWEFFKNGTSLIDFDKKELAKARAQLDIKHVSRESGPLEYISVETKSGLKYRIYEDGLIILEQVATKTLAREMKAIKEYYDTKLSKSLSFIFSKGAPVPKELANIQTILPYIITTTDATATEVKALFKEFGEEAYSFISSKKVQVYRGGEIIVINNLRNQDLAREIIETQIFFREYKTQLHRYLTIHRIIWEKIERIRERGKIKGNEVSTLRSELLDYQKTITLIDARIRQMDNYLSTRQKVANSEAIDDFLRPLFQFKFETLEDTHRYIQHLWGMTRDYLDSALQVFTELQQQSTKNSISSLQLVTTIGVVAGILGYLGKETLPTFTLKGLLYFAILMGITWVINTIISKIYKNRSYTITIRTGKKLD